MGIIKVLDNRLANMIAAGEVVERPSSVVKELVENSIDAKSKNISVYIYEAGRKKIIVEDDGLGMDKEDALLAFRRHATSKIVSELDLFRIKTLGFRGEALPSIASVSKLTLITSTGVDEGTKLEIINEQITPSQAFLRKGTIVQVEELFYNTPARLKYLKSDYTENANSVEVMCRIALAHPDISFSFYIDDKEQFKTTGRGDLLEVIANIYGYDVAKNMVPFEFTTNDFSVGGFLGKPNIAKASRYHMITLLNGRSVNMPKVQNAVLEGYRDYIIPGKFPFVILNLAIDFALVDVNVHPSKKEVRFSLEEVLRRELLEHIPRALKPAVIYQEATYRPKEKVEEEQATQLKLFDNTANYGKEIPKEEVKTLFKEVNETAKEVQYPLSENTFHLIALAQLNKTYIIAQSMKPEDGFYLIDQHAAMERINYEKFTKLYQEKINVMSPLIPVIINLQPSEVKLLTEEKLVSLKELGVELESFGLNAYKAVSVPVFIGSGDELHFVEELINQALHEDRLELVKLRSHAIATMACKASLKANTTLNEREMNMLLERLFTCDNPHNCPHGRPIIIHFTKYELEKMFKRTGL